MSHSAAIDDRKQALREYALARRRSARRAAGPGAGVRAANHYLAGFCGSHACAPGAVVSGYWAIREEIDAMPLLARLVGAGFVCCLVLCVDEKSQIQALDRRRWWARAGQVPTGATGPGSFVWTPGAALVAGAVSHP